MEPAKPPSSSSKTQTLDALLHAIGFEIEDLSPKKVNGRLLVTHKCCQVRFHIFPIFFFMFVSTSIGVGEKWVFILF